MGWMQKCYDTYENNKRMVGQGDNKEPLCPIGHMNATAQIEVIINDNGNFKNAYTVDKNDGRILIQVTEKSAGRASGIAPHALCDTLPYVGGDYIEYVEGKKDKEKAAGKFKAYSENLKRWCESEYSCTKIRAVYSYISKSCLIKDLINSGIISLDNGYLSYQKISGNSYEKCLVRFRVLGDEDSNDAVWKDTELIEKYTMYSINMLKGKKDYCYISGKESVIATNHPKGIIASSYGAKLLSANDESGFTYRGRFVDSNEAYAVSYEVSQKAHSALHWVIANQGISVGNKDKRTFVCWNPKGKEVIKIMDSPFGPDEGDEPIAKTNPEYRKKLKRALLGYREKLNEDDDIVIMSLEAATTGRLSVTYYNELMSSDFYNRLEKWYSSFVWYFTKFTQERKPIKEQRTPTMYEIVRCAYGTEDSTGKLVVNDKLFNQQLQRIIRCMLDDQPLPRDVVDTLFQRISNPQKYSYGNREKILSVACAAVVKKVHDTMKNKLLSQEEEEKIMELDLKNTNRSYLFGRLLAIMEKLEKDTYSQEERANGKRETNAMRYQNVFISHPMRTWMTLKELLGPYYEKLNMKSRDYYDYLIGEIVKLIESKDAGNLNKPLNENFLLGYYLQREDLYKKNNKSDESNKN